MVAACVGPFAQQRLDEALGLAVGLRPAGLREAVLGAQCHAGVAEEVGAIAGAVVGEDALDLDAAPSHAAYNTSSSGRDERLRNDNGGARRPATGRILEGIVPCLSDQEEDAKAPQPEKEKSGQSEKWTVTKSGQ